MLHSATVYSLTSGPKLLVLGAVHGNEKCGTHAIHRILKELESGQLEVKCGSVTFVPVCNPRAFEADTRFVDRNLNRYLVPQENPDCYEAQIGNVLCPLLEKCDVLLDLHSYAVGGAPFVFIGNPQTPEHDFANCLGAAAGITGWSAAYAASGRAQKTSNPNESVGTTEYARRFGAMAVTLECGQDIALESDAVAYQAIKNALIFLGLIEGELDLERKAPPLVEVKKVFYRDNGGALAKAWKNLDPVKAGEVIATDATGTSLSVPQDGVVILPFAEALAGTEWFYWGQERK